jgi:hypothetical protein
MPRPNFVSEADVARWSDEIDNSPYLSKVAMKSALLREVCYAGLWLSEELFKLQCPESLVARIQYSAGKASFGRNDFWEIHQQFLQGYQEGKLDFEPEPGNAAN